MLDPLSTPPSNRLRQWMRFSLRTLLVGVALVCLWLGWCVERARRQREAIRELHKLHVAVLNHYPLGKGSEAREAGFADRWLGLAFRKPVDYVGFQHAHQLFDDPQRLREALSLLPRIRGLKRLGLEGVPISDTELVYLQPLRGLEALNLSYTDVTDAGIAELKKTLPGCRIIR